MGEAEAGPVRTLQVEPLADYGVFALIDPDTEPFWPFDETTLVDHDLVVVENIAGIGFHAAARDFYPELRIWIYDQPAPELPGPWDDVRSAGITVRSGQLYVRSMMGDMAASFPLAVGRWAARCHVRGRAEARRRSTDELFFHGAEEWVVQLWPDGG